MHPVLIGSFRTDDESVLASADVCRFVAESDAMMESDGDDGWAWSLRVHHARETEKAAKDFVAARSERTAIILLGKAIATHREAPKSLGYEHLMFVAAMVIASSEHPMAAGMVKAPPLGKSTADGLATIAAILRVWNAWMATQADPDSV